MDSKRLESHLRWAVQAFPTARVLVLIESVYSMDGDRAPLREIVELKEKFGAWLLVDEAHAIGVVGRGVADWSMNWALPIASKRKWEHWEKLWIVRRLHLWTR